MGWWQKIRGKLRDASRATTDGYRQAGYPIEVSGAYKPEFEDFEPQRGQERNPVRAPWQKGDAASPSAGAATPRQSDRS